MQNMKHLFTLLLTALALCSAAQSEQKKLDSQSKKLIDSTTAAVKKDTVAIPIYVSEKRDTVKLDNLIYKGEGGVVRWCSPGYVITTQKVGTKDNKTFIPMEAVKVVGALDDKKRPVKPIQ
jgi:hypothetical protein